MHFAVESVSQEGARLGRLLAGSGRAALASPLCLLYTRCAAMPHLTVDLGASHPGAMLPLPTLFELPGSEVMAQYGKGIHKFFSLQEFLLYLSVQDPCTPPPQGYNEEKSTSIWTNGGRKKLTVSEHLHFVASSRPTVFECLCDTPPPATSSLKRTCKSVNRTLRFLDATLLARQNNKALQECAVLGAVEGGDVEEERRRSATETAQRPVDGFVLEGFDLPHCPQSQASLIKITASLLPSDKPRFIHGLRTPEEIFSAVEAGMDVFDSSYAMTATEAGHALAFPNHPSSKRAQPFEINLWEDRFESDFSCLVSGCTCYTCHEHTRAYLHHLLQTREMLASTLLMLHNSQHYQTFFASLQQSLRQDGYSHFKNTCLSLTNHECS